MDGTTGTTLDGEAITPEQRMENYQTEMEATATLVQMKLNTIESNRQDEIALDDAIQLIRNNIMLSVSTARFEVNNKLQYTNDDQRKSAQIVEEEGNQNLQNLKTSRSMKIVAQALAKNKVEYERRKNRGVELMMLFYANHPATGG